MAVLVPQQKLRYGSEYCGLNEFSDLRINQEGDCEGNPLFCDLILECCEINTTTGNQSVFNQLIEEQKVKVHYLIKAVQRMASM